MVKKIFNIFIFSLITLSFMSCGKDTFYITKEDCYYYNEMDLSSTKTKLKKNTILKINNKLFSEKKDLWLLFSKDNNIFYIQEANVKKLEYVSNNEINDTPELIHEYCGKINNSSECYRKIENNQLTMNKNIVTRNNSLLKIKTNKGFITFNNSEDGNIVYNFFEYIPEINMCIVSKSDYDGGSVVIINLLSGKQKELWNIPIILSPNKKKIVSVSQSLDYSYIPNGLQICKISEGKIESEFEVIIKNWEPRNVKWINNTTISGDKIYHFFDKKGYLLKDDFILKYQEQKWILE